MEKLKIVPNGLAPSTDGEMAREAGGPELYIYKSQILGLGWELNLYIKRPAACSITKISTPVGPCHGQNVVSTPGFRSDTCREQLARLPMAGTEVILIIGNKIWPEPV